jgi:hypothetical protein
MMIVNKELEKIRTEAVMTYYKILYQHLPTRTEENHKNLSLDNQSLADIQTQDLLNMKQEH